MSKRYEREQEVFESLNEIIPFERVSFRGEMVYRGPEGKYFSLIDYGSHIRIRIESEESERPDERLYIYRIAPEEDVIYVIKDIFKNMVKNGEKIFQPSFFYPAYAIMIKKCLRTNLTEEHFRNLCELYDAGVTAGGPGYTVASACREVLHIYTMKANPSIDEELHRMLIQIPEMFYDFLFSLENNLSGDYVRQERVKNFIRKNPKITTEDIIIYTSYMDVYEDERFQELWDLFKISPVLNAEKMKLLEGEIVGDDGKYHGFCITSIIKDGVGYRIRQRKNVFFMDYMNACVACCTLQYSDQDTARIYSFRINGKIFYKGVIERLIDFAERAIAATGKKAMVASCTPDQAEFLKNIGYEAVSPEENPFPDKIEMKKILK